MPGLGVAGVIAILRNRRGLPRLQPISVPRAGSASLLPSGNAGPQVLSPNFPQDQGRVARCSGAAQE